jgi:hypothetical protein
MMLFCVSDRKFLAGNGGLSKIQMELKMGFMGIDLMQMQNLYLCCVDHGNHAKHGQ